LNPRRTAAIYGGMQHTHRAILAASTIAHV
jgi:hypothetical protein